MNSQPEHLPSPEKTFRIKKKKKEIKKERKREKKIDSLQFPLMNGEFPISILITQARLSAVFKITTQLNSKFSYWF